MPPRPKPIHPRKLEIVEAAVICFLENGYHQTGMRDIVRQAGVSLGNLYNHFSGKEAILVFIADIEREELSDLIDKLTADGDPQARLIQFIRDYSAYVARPENALLGVEILTEALRNPVIADVFGRNRNRLIDAICDCLTDGADAGIFAPQPDRQAAAYMIIDTLEGLGLRNLSAKPRDSTAQDTIQAVLLNGLTT